MPQLAENAPTASNLPSAPSLLMAQGTSWTHTVTRSKTPHLPRPPDSCQTEASAAHVRSRPADPVGTHVGALYVFRGGRTIERPRDGATNPRSDARRRLVSVGVAWMGKRPAPALRRGRRASAARSRGRGPMIQRRSIRQSMWSLAVPAGLLLKVPQEVLGYVGEVGRFS
jgi:hypothetical protein